LKNISSDSSPQPKKQSGAAPKKQFIVIEIPQKDKEHDYPKAVFACNTLEEALALCKQMNADAGHERYGVQRPATHPKS
jgi:hypothetical protein